VNELSVQAVVVMSEAEARAETDAIRNQFEDAQDTWDAGMVRLREVEEREGWAALGYTSMARYVMAEFSKSRGHAYRLIDQMNVTLQLVGVSHGETGVKQITHRQVKALKSPEAQAEVGELVEQGHSLNEAVEHVSITRTPFAGGSAIDFEPYDDEAMILRCKGCQRVGAVGARFEVLRGGSGVESGDDDGIVRERFNE